MEGKSKVIRVISNIFYVWRPILSPPALKLPSICAVLSTCFQDDFLREVTGRIRCISTSENESTRVSTIRGPIPRQVSPKSSPTTGLVRSPSCPADLDRPRVVMTAVTAVQTETVFPYEHLLDVVCTATASTQPDRGEGSDELTDATANPYNVLDQVMLKNINNFCFLR